MREVDIKSGVGVGDGWEKLAAEARSHGEVYGGSGREKGTETRAVF
jgi:hypothetical protein